MLPQLYPSPTADRPAPDDSGSEASRGEVDLAIYGRALWFWRWWLLGAALAAGLMAWGVASLRPPLFEAWVTLRANTSGHLGEYALLLRNRTLAASILSELGLDQPPYGWDPVMLSEALRIETVPNAPLLVVRLRLPDAELARRTVNAVALQAVRFQQQLAQQQHSHLVAVLSSQLEEAKRRFEEASSRLKTFQQSAQIELSRRDVEARLDKRGELMALSTELVAERARLAQAEQELANQPSLVEGGSSVPGGAALLGAVVKDPVERAIVDNSTPPAAGGTVPPQARERAHPMLNPVYQVLAYQVSASRVRLAALERQYSELVGRLRLDAQQLQMISDLHEKESRLAQLRQEFELARDVYYGLAKRLEETVQAQVPPPDLQVIDPALRPDAPIPRRRALAAFAAMTSVIVLGMVCVVVATAARRRATW